MKVEMGEDPSEGRASPETNVRKGVTPLPTGIGGKVYMNTLV